MLAIAGLVVGIVVFALDTTSVSAQNKNVTFDKNFHFGAASASYQIEGCWDKDGKSPNIWDEVTHRDWGYTEDRSNGDVAANSYEFFEKDIDALDNIGVSAHMTNLLSLSANEICINSKPHTRSAKKMMVLDQKFNFP